MSKKSRQRRKSSDSQWEVSGRKNSNPLISRIEVKELFHTYSYVLETPTMPGPDSGRLMLLYGNNGSGKTTILNLLYHLLHPEPYGGHRSFLAGLPFTLFEVELFNGAIVSAYRNEESSRGIYNIRLRNPQSRSDLNWQWHPDRRRRAEGEDTIYLQYCDFLKKLGISFHYLRDSRRVEGKHVRPELPPAHRIFERGSRIIIQDDFDEDSELISPDSPLTDAVESAMQWFRQRALSATNVGFTSVNSIYRDIIKRIVSEHSSPENESERTPDDLIRDLVDLKMKTKNFAKFGLTPELDVDEIISNLGHARAQHIRTLSAILGPYLDGHAARLKALDELRRVIESFVSLLSDFYSHKKLNVHIPEGLGIESEVGQELEPSNLSSGEKQLLLLLCNAISSRRDKTILMIDEPEISLNVRWQRELIPALLTCMAGTGFQIILATHSVELLALYRDYVTPLDNAG